MKKIILMAMIVLSTTANAEVDDWKIAFARSDGSIGFFNASTLKDYGSYSISEVSTMGGSLKKAGIVDQRTAWEVRCHKGRMILLGTVNFFSNGSQSMEPSNVAPIQVTPGSIAEGVFSLTCDQEKRNTANRVYDRALLSELMEKSN